MDPTENSLAGGSLPIPVPPSGDSKQPFAVTEKAAKRLIDLLKPKNVQDESGRYGLRIRVVGGGCNGMQYKMDPESKPRPNDKVFDAPLNVRVFIDIKSLIYLKGTVLDAGSNPRAGTFEFKNPNVKSSCGCGLSFQA